ncbi:uncharacterized protein RCO7_14614 [Rhynchosporium graminicola]|uniref:Uncharacterized protein n=1 Tax=Rhynchosporium graminicola TaxID=2792576 RepID=A0A1E1KUK5_9HELO|nr:uncharacterized protein RCO7_14614 [Rhynchosporium commune]
MDVDAEAERHEIEVLSFAAVPSTPFFSYPLPQDGGNYSYMRGGESTLEREASSEIMPALLAQGIVGPNQILVMGGGDIAAARARSYGCVGKERSQWREIGMESF